MPCHPHGWAPVTSSQEVADEPSHFSCLLPSSSQPPAPVTSSLSLWFPANVHSTECHHIPPVGTQNRKMVRHQAGIFLCFINANLVLEWNFYTFNTHLLIRNVALFFLAVIWLALRQLPQIGTGLQVQLLPDVETTITVGEVVGGVASRGQEVGISSFFQQQFDQWEVLLVYGQMQCTATVVLLLVNRKRGVSVGWSSLPHNY